MPKRQRFWWVIVCLMIGCGPAPIYLRPSLDTPAQHLANGNALLEQEKWRDASREFERARELDPFFTEAYVGLAIALGHEGEFETAVRIMDQARQTAMSQEQRQKVAEGDAQLHQMIVDQGFFK
ncbi:MAG: tetratricopeptide repeat protein [Desulfatitalea sp.]|nr:tetratricopeptide repeat protein [Desulfatitalea sp.]MBI5895766.1 tetratricopeptide repeat protein [Desulfobacterales bacterium]